MMTTFKKDHDTEKSDNVLRAGPLKSQLQLEIHTDFAIQLWNGRKMNAKKHPKNEGRWPTPSVPLFLSMAARISDDAFQGFVFAEMWLYRLEQKLEEGMQRVQAQLQEMETTLKFVPDNIHISGVSSTAPVNLDVFSRTPIGYRCVWLLVGVDQLVLKVLQAFHYGMLSRQLRDKILEDACHQVRRALNMAFRYRHTPINRNNLDIHNEDYRQAIKYFGELDNDIVKGKKRSAFLPALKNKQ